MLSAEIVGKDGNATKLDINNPSEDKTFKVAMDTYYANGRDGFTMLKSLDKAETVFEEDKDYMVAEYIKKLQNEGKEIEIKNQNRIKIVE